MLRVICLFSFFVFLMTCPTLNVVTINVNGLRSDPVKRTATFKWLKENKYNVALLQETHSIDDFQTKIWDKQWGGETFWSHGTNQARGVGILVEKNIEVIKNSFKTDDNGQLARIRIKWEEKTYSILNVYAPNKNRHQFFDKLKNDWITATDNIIMGGDFNCVENPGLDRNNINQRVMQTQVEEGVACLQETTNNYMLQDLWRRLNPTKTQCTWTNTTGSWSRLDRFYINVIDHLPVKSEIVPFIHSDHNAVSLTIENTQIKIGRGAWKLNASILKSQEYNDIVKQTVEEIFHSDIHNFQSILQRWDFFKIQIKQKSIAFSRKLNKRKKKHKRKLLHDLEKATEKNNIKRMLYLQEQLKTIENEDINGVRIRSKAKWHEEGEKSSKYFCRLEKRNGQDRLFRSVKTENGEIKETTEEVMKEQIKFYKKLYTKDNIDLVELENFLKAGKLRLKDEEAAEIDHPITEDEIKVIVKSMAPYKSPGLDGICAEWYKHFIDDLSPILKNLIDEIFENGQLTNSQQKGLITLLYKKGPRDDLRNWRPISLLNIDYKIITKILAKRLGTVMPLIIEEDQTCSIKGRNIDTNITLTRDIIDYANIENKPLAIIALDQEKAFDRVELPYLKRVLESFNFGKNFRKWISILYNNISSCILTNGLISDEFKLTRGLRQGCALSAPLYVIIAETFANNIRDANISGFTFPDHPNQELRISQYADDNNLFITNDPSIIECFRVIRKFESVSGAKLNSQKTEGLWVGSWRNRQDRPIDITWKSDFIKTLGAHLGNIPLEDLNIRSKLERLNRTLNLWRQRNLSLKGKKVVINTIASSGLWYYTNVIPQPKWLQKEFKTIIFNFLWSGKGRPLKDKTAYLPTEKGGLGIIDIDYKITSQRTMFVKRLQQANGKKWTLLPLYWLNDLNVKSTDIKKLGLKAFHTNLKLQGQDVIPKYYQEVLNAWKRVGGCRKLMNHHQILDEIIYSNSEYKEEMVMNYQIIKPTKTLIDFGIITIRDLYTKRTLRRRINTFIENTKDKIYLTYEVRWSIPIINNYQQIDNNDPPLAIKKKHEAPNNYVELKDVDTKTLKKLSYSLFNNDKPSCISYWESKFNDCDEYPNEFWQNVFQHNHDKKHERKKADLSYKIIHRMLTTGYKLFQIGRIEDPSCCFCKDKVETTLHLFCECPHTVIFWLNVGSILSKIYPDFKLISKIIILGVQDTTIPEEERNLINFLLIEAKYCIWISRNRKVFDNKESKNMFQEFKSAVRSRMKSDIFLGIFKESFWCIRNTLASGGEQPDIFV